MNNEQIPNIETGLPEKASFARKAIFTCCSIILILILALLFAVGYLSAKSGLFDIPIMSNLFYREPFPSYKIQPKEFDIDSRIIESISKDPARASVIKMSDEEFSYFIKNAFTQEIARQMNGDENSFYIDDFQIIFKNDSLEMFVKFLPYNTESKIKRVILTVNCDIKWENNNITADFTNIKLGQLNIPKSLINIIAKENIQKLINQINEQIPALTITKINLLEKQINIEFTVKQNEEQEFLKNQ